MQVILLDKVVNLGNLGEVVKVKDGYARNFLIPSGRARRATEAAIKEFEARRAELEKAAAEKLTKNGYAEAKAQVRMPTGPIKVVGDSTVSVALHTDVVVDITVAVYGETA